MDRIIALAERLGKTVAESKQAADLQNARDQLKGDEELQKALAAYRQQSVRIGQLERDNKPVEVDDKHKLTELHDKLAASDLFKKFTAAQVEYVDLLRRVNEAIQMKLAPAEGQDEPEGEA